MVKGENQLLTQILLDINLFLMECGKMLIVWTLGSKILYLPNHGTDWMC